MVRSPVLPSSLGDGMCDISVALPPATATAPLSVGAPRQPEWGFGGGGGCSNNVKVSSAGASLHRVECQPLFNWARLREEQLLCLPQQFLDLVLEFLTFLSRVWLTATVVPRCEKSGSCPSECQLWPWCDRRDGWDWTPPKRWCSAFTRATHIHWPWTQQPCSYLVHKGRHYLGPFQNKQTVNRGGKFHMKKESLSLPSHLLPLPPVPHLPPSPCSFLQPWIPGSDYQQAQQSLFTSTRTDRGHFGEQRGEGGRDVYTKWAAGETLALSCFSHHSFLSSFCFI